MKGLSRISIGELGFDIGWTLGPLIGSNTGPHVGLYMIVRRAYLVQR